MKLEDTMQIRWSIVVLEVHVYFSWDLYEFETDNRKKGSI